MEKQPLLQDRSTSNYGGGEGEKNATAQLFSVLAIAVFISAGTPSQPMAMPNGPRAADPPPPPSLPPTDLLGDVSVLGYEEVTFQGGT